MFVFSVFTEYVPFTCPFFVISYCSSLQILKIKTELLISKHQQLWLWLLISWHMGTVKVAAQRQRKLLININNKHHLYLNLVLKMTISPLLSVSTEI